MESEIRKLLLSGMPEGLAALAELILSKHRWFIFLARLACALNQSRKDVETIHHATCKGKCPCRPIEEQKARKKKQRIYEDNHVSKRQREIAELLLRALTRRQIAGELKISEATVKAHVTELYRRLNISSRAELFRMLGIEED